MQCPCGLPGVFKECCEPLIKGHEPAKTPEALMRSRYSAFATKDMDYVLETTDRQTLHSFDLVASREWAESAEFFKLEILRATDEGNKGIVEFKAHFRLKDGADQVHHELSKFRKQAGRWYFREGKVYANPS